jgi:hypothetical protein
MLHPSQLFSESHSNPTHLPPDCAVLLSNAANLMRQGQNAPTPNPDKDPEYAGRSIRLVDDYNYRYSEAVIGPEGDFDITLETKKDSDLLYTIAPVGYQAPVPPPFSIICGLLPSDPGQIPIPVCSPDDYKPLFTNINDHPTNLYPDESMISPCSSN